MAYTRPVTPISLRVRELRQALGLTQAALAERAGLQRVTVSRIERHRVKGIDFSTLERLADALGVDPGFLIVRESGRRPAPPRGRR